MMRPGKLIAALAGIAIAAGSAIAADPPESGTPPEKLSALEVYGDDPCPRSSGDEIVVCARLPESERYRVPKPLRKQRKRDVPSSVAWAAGGVQDARICQPHRPAEQLLAGRQLRPDRLYPAIPLAMARRAQPGQGRQLLEVP